MKLQIIYQHPLLICNFRLLLKLIKLLFSYVLVRTLAGCSFVLINSKQISPTLTES